MKQQKKLLSLVLIVSMLLTLLTGCKVNQTESNNEDIIILFTNDIHGSIEGDLTMSQIAAYKKYLLGKTDNVLLVDCGDAVQGSAFTAVTNGSIMIDVMNEVGYDYAILGNHEFDYGQQRLSELVDLANAQYLCCNITYSGSGETALTQTKPYEIVNFGSTSVAFVGVTTPHSITSSAITNFTENDTLVYDFCGGDDNTKLAECVQNNVNAAREEGADYVILLAHLGRDGDLGIFNSELLINATNGIDAVLDGHSHQTYTKVCIENKDGNPVVLAQTGTKLENLGQLVIGAGGIITVTMIDELSVDDEAVGAKIDALTEEYTQLLDKFVAHSETAISDYNEAGVRTVRNTETAIGDLCSDAYRAFFDADISFINAGGIRSGLPAGDITYQDIINVNPFGNMLCLVEVTGQEILDMLEYFVKKATPETVSEDGTYAVGESGSFPCMSGITFTVDTRIESPVIVDENDLLVGIDENIPRRVSDVKIQSDDEYLPIDTEKTYTLASHDYMIIKGGSGMQYLLENHNIIQNSVVSDYQALIEYIVETLGGDLSAYQTADNRITFLR